MKSEIVSSAFYKVCKCFIAFLIYIVLPAFVHLFLAHKGKSRSSAFDRTSKCSVSNAQSFCPMLFMKQYEDVNASLNIFVNL